ncbi:ABC transporter substrate-binding protein [Kitasatospora sp. MMS16-BH015]|uniref:MCE family protein n=1 Tax=Kitasatospora sp. MMS16-BH015 TaxID=2018025 RepID=UPI000CA27E1E|nr:MCE family protein [Kitasatospora sp. MMS16-BH015]AUG81161.1 ABC transporter substrate-binding protein [Kitasatospora sp. MMS16-BH015]
MTANGSNARRRYRRYGRRGAGVVFLLVPALLAWLAVAVYDRAFTDSADVTVETGSAGHELHLNADVKLRGVVVGQVRRISSDGGGARLTLALDPAKLPQIPAQVSVQLLPTTLFGERYVALVPDTPQPAGHLAAGAVIRQDHSADAVELQQVLDHLMPVLTAVQPAKLSATLSAVATALSGRGAQLGQTLDSLDAYLKQLNPELPTLNADIRELVTVSRAYDRAAPDLVQALTDFTRTSSTIAQQQAGLAEVYGSTTSAAQDLTAFLQQNKDNLIHLTADSTGTLNLLAEYAPAFPCTLRTMATFVPAMDHALGKGTDQPGLHVSVSTLPSRGGYQAGTDAPSYRASTGPQCYAVPYTGRTTPLSNAPSFTGPDPSSLGLPNSPQENHLVGELLATATPAPAAAAPAGPGAPDWASLLAGPVYRGAEVTVR